MELNEKELKIQLDYFDHKIFWFHVFKPTKDGERQLGHLYQEFCSRERVIELCKKFNGQGILCCAINERPKGKTLATDITTIENIFIDVDVRKARKVGYVSTPEDHKHAINTGKKIFDFLQEKNIDPALIVDSGNGCQLFFKVNIDISNEEKQATLKQQATILEEHLKQFVDDVVEVDCITKDFNRRVKLIGTINKKDTNQAEDRISNIVHYNKNYSPIKNTESFLKITSEQITNGVFKEQPKVQEIKKDVTHSGLEFKEVCNLIKQGRTKNHIFQRMALFKKWSESPEAYKEMTYKKALQTIRNNKEQKNIKIKESIQKDTNVAYCISSYLTDLEYDINNCPFTDNSDVFLFDDNKDTWSCSCCNRSGNLIRLHAELEDISYYKAKIYIEKKLGIRVPSSVSQDKAQFELEQVRHMMENYIDDVFCDESYVSWVTYKYGRQTKTHTVESSIFLSWLRLTLDHKGFSKEKYYEYLKKIYIAEGRTGEKRRLYLRRFEDKFNNYIVQIDEDKAIKIIPNGEMSYIKSGQFFRNFEHQLPYLTDINASIDDINMIDDFTNFNDENDLLYFKISLAIYLIPGIQKSPLLFFGPPGSSKSIICRMLVSLVDPSNTMQHGIGIPEKIDDWVIIAREHAFYFFDNLNRITNKQQDEFCKTVTGTSYKKRKLYTDMESCQVEIRTTGCLNAIELSDLQNDFLDRVIKFELKRIDNNKRKGEQTFMNEFDFLLPKFRGSMCQILAKARTIIDTIKLKRVSEARLSDYAKWFIACGIAMGVKQELCEELLQLKVSEQQESAIEHSKLAIPIIEFMSDKESWCGTGSDLLKVLTEQKFGQIIGTGDNETVVVRGVPNWWFTDPRQLGIELRRIENILQIKGFIISKRKSNDSRIICIENKNYEGEKK